jgi:entericidin B
MELPAWSRVYLKYGRPDCVLPAPRKGIHMIRKVLLAIAVASIAITASACNTVKGAGRDIESVGKAGDEAIN